jgi:hypothetical protein
MRRRTLLFVFGSFTVAVCAACARHDDHAQVPGRLPEARAAGSGAVSGPPQYIVADPAQQRGVNMITITLPNGALGMVVERARIVVARGEPRVGPEVPDENVAHAAPIPQRLGGGYLFATQHVLFRAESFDGPLKAIARMPDTINDFSFTPKGVLARLQNGERWGVTATTGERIPVEPLGAADVECLDDGRALAFNDQGGAYASTDYGAHWTDITAHIKTSPSAVRQIDGDIWLFESGGAALHVEPDGHVASYDKQPTPKEIEVRPKDPRWRSAESPLHTAFHAGASLDDATALVVSQGDLVRVDVHTGEIVGVLAGKLPPDARCEAVPTANDVVFACVATQRSGSQAVSFVASRTLGDETPQIEQTFGVPGVFYASDDGGLAYSGPCSAAPGAAAPTVPTVACVRQPGGTWQELDLSALSGDAGPADVNVARWVPRADGRAVAILLDPNPLMFDPRAGTTTALPNDVRDALAQGLGRSRVMRSKRGYYVNNEGGIVDWSWSFGATGTLRGWQSHGGIVEIGEDGKTTKSPYAFDIVASGPYALGRTNDGRLYQSTDHGATWSEVAAPPGAASTLELLGCSSAGCDLGGFYRVGWAVRPPRPEPPPPPAPPAPDVRRSKPLELACRPSGPAASRLLKRTERSPEDLGLGGVTRLPVPDASGHVTYLRTPTVRGIVSPVHETPVSDSDTASLRMILFGYGTQKESDVIEVLGPNKAAAGLRRSMSFLPAFDPTATVRRATLAMSDVIAAGRAAGMSNEDILSDDMTEAGNVLAITPADPAAPNDLAYHNARGMLALVRSKERVRVVVRPPQNDALVVSGAAISETEAVFMDLETGTGVEHVFKVAGGSLSDLFDVSPTSSEAAYYPANPDTIAIGPKGDVGVLRTPSGSDPPWAGDPAYVLQPAMPPAPLAPWSTARFADDASCKGDPGWRTTVSAIGPWVRVTTPELRVDDAPMIARVKWNDKRVCLEGIEVKLPNVVMRSGSDLVITASSWLVARGGTFVRVAVGEGFEWRQPLECSLAASASNP